MVERLLIKKNQALQNTEIDLPSSKSESNRVLIIQGFAEKQGKEEITLENLSEANDSRILKKLLASQDKNLDVEDAGTTMRFLAAFFAFSGQEKILTGTTRMQERPIKVLVKALNDLGANIRYLEKVGFPPIHILPKIKNTKDKVEILGNVSSQYISALLMLAPTLRNGLEIILLGEVKSKPYIQMTLDLMQHFGIQYAWQENTIKIEKQMYQANSYIIQADWSAASYFYSLVGIEKNIKVLLKNLKKESLQGDKKTAELARYFGVESIFVENGVWLSFNPSLVNKDLPIWDFSDCPDLAQTFTTWASAEKRGIVLKGVESLKIKETDRIEALQKELQKFGTIMYLKDNTYFFSATNTKFSKQKVEIFTYQDHRMAMALTPLAIHNPLIIENPDVVVKSYPNFWENIEKLGFEIREL